MAFFDGFAVRSVNAITDRVAADYGVDPIILACAAAAVFGAAVVTKDDALALVGIGTETCTLDDDVALAAAYRAAAA